MEIFHSKLKEILDGNLLAVVDELERVCPVSAGLYMDFPLSLFLTQCVYPGGDRKRVPIRIESSLECVLLGMRVGELPEGAVWQLCEELAGRANRARELHSGQKLYVFLNKTIPQQPKPTAVSVTQKRWAGVAGQRRSNR